MAGTRRLTAKNRKTLALQERPLLYERPRGRRLPSPASGATPRGLGMESMTPEGSASTACDHLVEWTYPRSVDKSVGIL